MIKSFPELPEWSFELDEISAGVYKVVGTDKSGHKGSTRGLGYARKYWRKNDQLG